MGNESHFVRKKVASTHKWVSYTVFLEINRRSEHVMNPVLDSRSSKIKKHKKRILRGESVFIYSATGEGEVYILQDWMTNSHDPKKEDKAS